MTKTLLLISGGEKSVDIANGLRAMGHAAVVSDSDPQAPAFALADSCLIADVHGASETAAAAERYNRKIRKIDGVLSTADAPLTGVMVTERLRLPGPPLHVAELIADRLMLRRCFASAGVAAPWPRPQRQTGGESRSRRCHAAGRSGRFRRRAATGAIAGRESARAGGTGTGRPAIHD
jgi:hypothetical protein